MKNKNIFFCKKCLYSNLHPLGITFDEEGVCSGCKVHGEKDSLDWKFRFNKLINIVRQYKSKNSKNYDCIVPVTGAGDSYYILNIVKNKLKLNPLLVTYNKYYNTNIGIKNLSNLRIKFDCDILFQNINPISVKKITRYTFSEFGNIYWPILAGQSVFPVQVAIKYKIPLIIWGAHQGVEQVGMFSYKHEAEMTRRYRHDHDLFGLEADDLLKLNNNLIEEDIWQYRYPEYSEIYKNGIRGIYLNNYVRWDPLIQHIEMVNKFDYLCTNFSRTFDTYDYVDCFNYANLHDYLKLVKHGYSKVTDHVCREIRFKRISRADGLFLIKKYERRNIKFLDLFLKWIGMDKNSLYFVINRHRNLNFWKEKDINKWIFNGLSQKIKIKEKSKKERINNFYNFFLKNYNVLSKLDKNYITFGKGFDN